MLILLVLLLALALALALVLSGPVLALALRSLLAYAELLLDSLGRVP